MHLHLAMCCERSDLRDLVYKGSSFSIQAASAQACRLQTQNLPQLQLDSNEHQQYQSQSALVQTVTHAEEGQNYPATAANYPSTVSLHCKYGFGKLTRAWQKVK